MSKVLCFGELLLRFSPYLDGEWISQAQMPVFIGGAELNTATALARWNMPVAYCTTLPDHYLTKEIIEALGKKNIDTDRIQLSGNRIGTYYLPQGADLKAAGVIYDRAYSSFWDLQLGMIDWDQILKDVAWFHFSAICPALNANVAAVCKEALQAAAQRNITISVDLNYRAKLWQYGKTPLEVMPELVRYCNVIMGNVWAAEKMLGVPINKNLEDTKDAYLEQALQTSKGIINIFPACTQVANTFRFDREEGLHYYATLYKDGGFYHSNKQQANAIVDKVGSGDTFMAGLIYGIKKGWSPQQVIDFSAAAAFNKLFIKGDATTSSVEEIQKKMAIHG